MNFSSPSTTSRWMLMSASAAVLLIASAAMADPQPDHDNGGGSQEHPVAHAPNPAGLPHGPLHAQAAQPQQRPTQPQQQPASATPMHQGGRQGNNGHGEPNTHYDPNANHDRNDHADGRGNIHDDHYAPDDRHAWHDPNDHRHGPDLVIHAGSDGYYRRPYPGYISAPAPYYDPRWHRNYYYSSYYSERLIPVETAQPYVEIRCMDQQPITGTIVGGLAGGLIGNQFGRGSGRAAATIGGALLGAIVGQDVGRADESCAYQALEYAQPNTQVVWANPQDNYSYTITPGPVVNEGGRYCREYQAKILVGNELQDGYGTACRAPDGSWQVVN